MTLTPTSSSILNMETATQTGMNFPGHSVGRCRQCKRPHRADGAWSTRCECGATVKLERVVGFFAPEVKCGALCRNAVGPSCDCSCGGANHGCNH